MNRNKPPVVCRLPPLAVAAALASALLLGCATNGPPAPRSPAAERPDAPAAADAPDGKDKQPGERLVVHTADGRTAISRDALLSLQRLGPQRFIAAVRVRPAFKRRRFVGWRILAYGGPGRLHRGDIITRVNGRRIERPGQFFSVWKRMASRKALEVEMLRDGRPLKLSYPIVDQQQQAAAQ